MANVEGRPIWFYLVKENGKLKIHEKTDVQMDEWLKTHPTAKLAARKPFKTHEEAKLALRQATSS